MWYKHLEITNGSRNCIRYFYLLKENEYLVVTDKDGIIKATFFKKNNEIYEYFNLYNIKKISEYVDFKFPLSFLFRNEPNANSYTPSICSYDEWKGINKKNNLFFAQRELKKETENNAKTIYSDILKDGGKMVSFGMPNKCGGLLVCAVSSDEDYYWVYIDTNLQICLSSCVGGYEILDKNCVEFNILNYLIENEPQSLYERIINRFNDSSDAIFTPIVIYKKLIKMEKVEITKNNINDLKVGDTILYHNGYTWKECIVDDFIINKKFIPTGIGNEYCDLLSPMFGKNTYKIL